MLHALAPLDTEIPENQFDFAVFDIETDPRNHARILAVGFYDGSTYREYPSLDELASDVLVGKYRSWRIYAHNGGRFDFVHLIAVADARGWRWKALMGGKGGTSAISVDIYRASHVYHFLDSYALLPAKLKDLTTDLCPELEKGDIDWDTFNAEDYDHAMLARYLERDCRGLYRVLEVARDTFRTLGTELKRTIGATAMSLLRRRYLRRPWPVYRWTRRLTSLGMYGGRTEVFRRQAGELFNADVVSMYPYVMATNDPPVFQPRRVGPGAPINQYGIYRVRATVPDMPIPPLPLRSDKLYFPVGTFDTVAWAPELEIAREAGCRIKVLEGIVWKPEPEAFAGYVDSLWRIKARGGAWKAIAKLALNSTYGKFGQRGSFLTIQKGGDVKVRKAKGEDGDIILNDALGVFARWQYRESPNMLHHLGGWITSLARAHLWRLLTASKRPAYCDTDSVYSETRWREDSGLGGLTVAYARDALFMAPKLYCYDELESKGWKHVTKAKGAPGADPCRGIPGKISHLCTVKQYLAWSRLIHLEMTRHPSGLDLKRLGGSEYPFDTRPPVVGRDIPDAMAGLF